jgi:hypothetical protein
MTVDLIIKGAQSFKNCRQGLGALLRQGIFLISTHAVAFVD